MFVNKIEGEGAKMAEIYFLRVADGCCVGDYSRVFNRMRPWKFGIYNPSIA